MAGIALKAAARRLIARRAMQKYALPAAATRLDGLAHGADVIWGDQRIAAAERNRVAGVVHERARGPAPIPSTTRADQQRVIRFHGRVQPAQDLIADPGPVARD